MPRALNLMAEFRPLSTPRVRSIGPYRIYETRDHSLDRDLQYAVEHGFDGVMCSVEALDHVRQHPFRALHVDRRGARTPVALGGFQHLRAVACGDADLAGLRELEYVYTGGTAVLPDPAPSLVWLSLGVIEWRDLHGLHAPALRHLRVQKGRLRTLEGLQRSTELQIVEIDGCSQLTDVSALARIESLYLASLMGCRKVQPEGFAHSSIRELALVRCGRIASLQFLLQMSHLRVLRLTGTAVDDGDLGPISRHPGLEEVSMDGGDGSTSIPGLMAARPRTPVQLDWDAGTLKVAATCHCSIEVARALLTGLFQRDAMARAAMTSKGVAHAAELVLSTVLLAPGTPRSMVLVYAANPEARPHVSVVFDAALAVTNVEPAGSRGDAPVPESVDPPSAVESAIALDLETDDTSVVERWRGRLPALLAAVRDTLRDKASETAVRYAQHHIDEVGLEAWHSAFGLENPPTIAEVLDHLRPVALWGDPSDRLHLDMTIGEDLTQYVLSFEVLPDATLGECVMES